jgi:mxaJ protein
MSLATLLCMSIVLCASSISAFAEDATTRPSEPIAPLRVLRVAADPNNLPFSNDKAEGFENKIAELVARDLGLELQYIWHAQRRGFFRETIKSREADVVIGVPRNLDMALTTKAYYRSTYAIVSRTDRELASIKSLDDAALKKLKVGVQVIGDDGADTPPAHALARRGIIDNVVGFTVYGDYREPNPPARIVDAVAKGDVDVAVVWGPLAGYFAKKQTVPLCVTPLETKADSADLPLTFDIAMGVSRKNTALRDQLDAVLARRRADIDKILGEYGVPRVEADK